MLFVCAKNAGKSQMAAGLMRQIVGDTVHVYSAGTKPGTAVNTLSAEAHRVSGGDNRESYCSAMRNGWGKAQRQHRGTAQRCKSRNPNRSNQIRDNRVSGWRTR